MKTAFFGNFDLASLTLLAFFLFFAGLVLYLRREDRREGYPLEEDGSGRLESSPGFLWFATPKTFNLPHGQGVLSKPNAVRDSAPLSARRSAPWSGSPLEPTGDPMQAGVGPGAYAQRANTPDLMLHGGVRIAPLRVATDYSIASEDSDPRGMTVVGADNGVAGVVVDIWVDRAEFLVRYLEVKLEGGGGKTVLVPMTMSVIQKSRNSVRVDAVLGSQFAGAPTPASPDQITLLEEERIVAYYGGGYLYATPSRTEPLL